MRTDLAAAIPLDAPYSLFVEPTNVCNFKCGICPESLPDYKEQVGYYQKMDWSTWSKIYNQINGWTKLRVLRLFLVGEPLLNRDLDYMIRMGKKISDRVELTTNGSLMTPDVAANLVDAELDYLRISVYGTSDAAYELETGQSRYRLGHVIENVTILRTYRDLYKKSTPHIYAELVSQKPNFAVFWKQWGDIADSLSEKELHNWGDSFVQLGPTHVDEKLACPYPFYQLLVRANGDVTVCCADWHAQLKLGNVHTETLQEMWGGELLRDLRERHLSGRRKEIPICKDCNMLYHCPDNIDSLITTGVL